jgi:hypothetical protein
MPAVGVGSEATTMAVLVRREGLLRPRGDPLRASSRRAGPPRLDPRHARLQGESGDSVQRRMRPARATSEHETGPGAAAASEARRNERRAGRERE